MKSRACLLILSAFSCLLFAVSCQSPKAKKSKYDNIAALMEYEFLKTRDPYRNEVPTDRLIEARRFRDEIMESINSLRSPVPAVSWEERGPNNVGGRTRVLWFDLNDSANGYKKVWAAGVSGGLWYTNDITASIPQWFKVNDLFDNLAICAFVQDPSNPQVMYFGTGEGWLNIDAVRGVGLWKTANGGQSWELLSSTSSFLYTQDLLIDKNGHLYANIRAADLTGSEGVQKSTDGGNTWTKVLTTPITKTGRGADLELSANGDIYASMGTAGSQGGIYRSAYSLHLANTGNAGTWVNITPDLNGTIAEPNGAYTRIELACAPSDGSVMYALMTGGSPYNCISIQQYNSNTNTWTLRTVPTIIDQGSNSTFTRNQGFYDLIATVKPSDANVLFIAGIDALRSDNNGDSWVQITNWSPAGPGAGAFFPNQIVHADHHNIVFAPGSSSRALWGTDGGVYYTANADVTGPGVRPTFTSKNAGYNVTQYYTAAMHPTNTNYFLAGSQDNGTHRFNASGISNVVEVTGGDGGFCFIDQDNPSIQITSYIYNNYFISTNGGGSFISKAINNSGQFINPADYASTENILYSGNTPGTYMRWTNPAALPAVDTQTVNVSAFGSARITYVISSPVTPNRVYFGLSNGSVVMVDDAHTGASKTGIVVKAAMSPARTVSGIAIDPGSEDHLLVSYSNYGVSSIAETFNGLSPSPVFADVEGNLPDMPVRWVIFDPRNSDWAMIATELGVWSTNNLNGINTEWSATNSGLANVRVDMIRYRPSDRTLLAATHGRGLFTAVLPSSSTPDINFSIATTSIAEQSASSDGCRRYRDHQLYLTIANPPTGSATITINPTSGTAVAGLDYDVTTNGSFTSPSTQVIFANGATESKQVFIRVYDDAEVEGPESVSFEYEISGSTNAQPGIGAQTHTLTISDNDLLPLASNSSTISVGSSQLLLGDETDGAPLNARIRGMRSRILYKASELTTGGLAPGLINSISLNLLKRSTRAYQNLTVKMGVTNFNYLVDAGSAQLTPVNVVKNPSSYTTVNGWNLMTLDAPFNWDGVSNLVLELCYDNPVADTANFADLTIGYIDTVASESQANMFFQQVTCSQAFSSVNLFSNGIKPEIRFGQAVSGTSVADEVTTVNEYFNVNNELYLYNTQGEIMARVKNLSGSHDYTCTGFQIDRSGNGASNFWNNNVQNRLMDKTFRIIPGAANPAGNYEITLYYTNEEVAGWEAATGNLFEDITVIKVQNAISNVTPSNPSAGGVVNIATPVIGTLGTHRTLTVTFSNGFSGFGAGIAGTALPVSLLNFSGKSNGGQVDLQWETSSEQNSRGFDIERSSDGQLFSQIGFVPSKGNSSTRTDYNYADKFPHQKNYYRLKQIDLDGKVTFGKIILIERTVDVESFVRLMQNPVQDIVALQFNRAITTRLNIDVMDVSGKSMLRWSNVDASSGQVRLSLGAKSIAKGTYLLRIRKDGEARVLRFVKS